MNQFANKSIERYNELVNDKSISSLKIFDILLKEFSRKKERKAKIQNLFNIKSI